MEMDKDKPISFREILANILARYDICDQEDINQAVQCIHFPQGWDQFIKQWIPRTQHEEFKQALFHAGFITTPQQQNRKTFLETYEEIEEVEINVSNIQVIQTQQYKWSQKLMEEIQVKLKENIRKKIQSQEQLSNFFIRDTAISEIFDLILRKGDLKEYFDQFKLASRDKFQNQIKNITFLDFIILLTKAVKQKAMLGAQMSILGIPVPIAYQIKDKIIFSDELCKNILGANPCSLILNIGSQKASKCGKTSFMARLMTIQEDYIEPSHISNVINLFTKLNFTEEKQPLLFADFNGVFFEQLPPRLLEIILNLSKHTSLLVIHLKKEQLQKKLLETQLYETLFKGPTKILIYVRDAEQTSQKVLKRCIPQKIKSKAYLRGLKSLIQYRQQLEYICNNSLNRLEPRISFQDITSPEERQKFKEFQSLVREAIKELQNNKKQLCIPNICQQERISQLYLKIKQEFTEHKKIQMHEKQIANLKQEKHKLTKFMQIFIKIMMNGRYCQQIFVCKLNEWKKKKIEPLREEYLNLTKSLQKQQTQTNQFIKDQIIQNLQKKNNFDISIDKFIDEIIIYTKQWQKQNTLKYKNIVSGFYQQSIKNVCPINIIDGKTLSFGNYALEDELKRINKRYGNKKIYVISVIGAQSSAKSTLLNFLFRCKFQTSEGRCTKGVYMSICQMETMVIVVLDTEGLLSVSERDIAFDHQIATFVLKISNIIIINNKGELTSTLKQMIEVCAYVLKCLYKDEKKKVIKPQKIIFALRDQIEPKGKFQQQMAAQIKNSLQQMKTTSNLDYRQFFSIETEDILCFPNAFVQKKGLIPKTGSTNIFNKTFQKCIVGMRKRIFDSLKDSEPIFNIYQFCKEAAISWETISQCGKNIMNYRSIYQTITKRNLLKILQDLQEEYTKIIEDKYQLFFDKLKQIKISSDLQEKIYQEELQSICKENYDRLTYSYKQKCKNFCSNNAWIQSYFRSIQTICKSYHQSNLNQLNKKVIFLKNQQKQLLLKNKLNLIIKTLIKQDKSEDQSIRKFQVCTKEIRQQQEKRIIDFHKQTKLQIEAKKIFESFLTLHKQMEMKINSINSCQSFFEQIDSSKKIQKQLIKNHCMNTENDHIEKWKDLFKKASQDFGASIVRIIHQKNITSPCDIYNYRQLFEAQINKVVGFIATQTCNLNKYDDTSYQLNQLQIRRYLFGKFYHITKKQININNINNIQVQNRLIQKKIDQYQQQLKRIINNRRAFVRIIKDDITLFTDNLYTEKTKQFEQIVFKEIDKLSLRLRPETIFKKAMEQTLYNKNIQDPRQYYIKCYKIVTNMNRFLVQVMCQYLLFTNSQSIIETNKQTVLQQTKNKLSTTINTINQLITQNAFEKARQFLTNNNMVGLAYLQNQKLDIVLICESITKYLSQNEDQIVLTVNHQIQGSQCEQKIRQYIEGTLIDKIIGCRHCCPMCGMKCILPSAHEGGHHVLKGYHSLSAFSGIMDLQTGQPVLDICQGKDSMKKDSKQRRWVRGKQTFDNLQAYINKFHPKWGQQLIEQDHGHHQIPDIVRLQKVWINIESAMLRNWKSHKPCNNEKIRQLRDKYELTDKDLNRIYEHPLTKAKQLLKDYYKEEKDNLNGK